MLTDEETIAACQEWQAKSVRVRAATAKKAERLRAMAHAAPSFHSEHLEGFRLGSQRLAVLVSISYGEMGKGAAPAIEVATLKKLFSSPTVKAWESAYRVIQTGLNDPNIAADPEMRGLFQNLLHAIADTADGGFFDEADPGYGLASFMVHRYLVTPEIEKIVLSQAGQRNGKKPHKNHAQAARKLPLMWAKLKEQGMSKSKAAPLIAAEIMQAESSVRRKLQGL